MDCDSDIDGDEIDNLHSTCAVTKDIKERYKEEEDAVMGDPWSNGALIEKEGNPTILQFKIPEDWTPPPDKSGETKFEGVDNPEKWHRYC